MRPKLESLNSACPAAGREACWSWRCARAGRRRRAAAAERAAGVIAKEASSVGTLKVGGFDFCDIDGITQLVHADEGADGCGSPCALSQMRMLPCLSRRAHMGLS